MKTLICVASLVLACCGLPAAAGGFELQGKVIHVDDGDTLVMLVNGNEKVTVRLSSIDAPESSHTNKEKGKVGQPFSDASKQFLASMVKGSVVHARCFEQDRYGR
ncbi:MAG: thermonuclease family protein, partial [Burkholderiaceae bacterium]